MHFAIYICVYLNNLHVCNQPCYLSYYTLIWSRFSNDTTVHTPTRTWYKKCMQLKQRWKPSFSNTLRVRKLNIRNLHFLLDNKLDKVKRWIFLLTDTYCNVSYCFTTRSTVHIYTSSLSLYRHYTSCLVIWWESTEYSIQYQ